MRATKSGDDDCFEVDGPQICTDMSSICTTRAATKFRVMRSNEYPRTSSHDGDGKPGTSTGHEDSYGSNHTVSSSGHNGGCFAKGDGNPGTSGDDGGCLQKVMGTQAPAVMVEAASQTVMGTLVQLIMMVTTLHI